VNEERAAIFSPLWRKTMHKLGPHWQAYIDKQTISIEAKCCAPEVARRLIP